jgi:fatty acid desaturase
MRLTDPTGTDLRPAGPLEKRLILDERDASFVRLTAVLSGTVLPAAVLLYVPGVFHWALALPYLAVVGWFVGPYILMLHNAGHRRLFNRRFAVLNHYIVWVLGPLFGQTPETYHAHHLGMHHPENNLPHDLSSTMKYERAGLVSFVRYWARFFFIGLIELAAYMWRHRRLKLLRRLLTGEIAWYGAVAALALLNWRATAVVLVAPFLLARFVMMAGNWAQHAFVDERDPASPYGNSITCINSAYNRRCFNDGYHIEHHATPNRHWTELPDDFLRNRRAYAERDAIVFEGIDFFGVWLLLVMRRFDALARRFVDLRPERPRTHEEIVALLRSRTRPILLRA